MSTSDTVGAFRCCTKIDADPEASGRLSLATQLILYTSERSYWTHPVRASCLCAVFHANVQGEVFQHVFSLDQPGHIDLAVGFVCQCSWPLVASTFQNGTLLGTFAEFPPLVLAWCLSPSGQLQWGSVRQRFHQEHNAHTDRVAAEIFDILAWWATPSRYDAIEERHRWDRTLGQRVEKVIQIASPDPHTAPQIKGQQIDPAKRTDRTHFRGPRQSASNWTAVTGKEKPRCSLSVEWARKWTCRRRKDPGVPKHTIWTWLSVSGRCPPGAWVVSPFGCWSPCLVAPSLSCWWVQNFHRAEFHYCFPLSSVGYLEGDTVIRRKMLRVHFIAAASQGHTVIRHTVEFLVVSVGGSRQSEVMSKNVCSLQCKILSVHDLWDKCSWRVRNQIVPRSHQKFCMMLFRWMKTFSLDDGFGMNPLASRLYKVKHSVATDRLDCSIPDFMWNTWHRLKRSQEVPKLLSLMMAWREILMSLAACSLKIVSKSKERLKPSSSGSGAAVDVWESVRRRPGTGRLDMFWWPLIAVVDAVGWFCHVFRIVKSWWWIHGSVGFSRHRLVHPRQL